MGESACRCRFLFGLLPNSSLLAVVFSIGSCWDFLYQLQRLVSVTTSGEAARQFLNLAMCSIAIICQLHIKNSQLHDKWRSSKAIFEDQENSLAMNSIAIICQLHKNSQLCRQVSSLLFWNKGENSRFSIHLYLCKHSKEVHSLTKGFTSIDGNLTQA